jgi:Tfp pilus assembly protein PilO
MKLTVSDGFITMLPLDVRVGGAYFSFGLFNIIKINQYSSTFDFYAYQI